MLFAYKGISDRKRSGYVYAEDKKEAIMMLKKDGFKAIYYLEEKFNHPSLNKAREFISKELNKISKQRKKKEKKELNVENIKNMGTPIVKDIRDFMKRGLSKKRQFDKMEELPNILINNTNYIGDLDSERVNLFETGRKFDKKSIDWDLIVTEGKEKSGNKIKVKRKEIVIFTKRLKMMLLSGISLPKALNLLYENPNKNMRKIISGVMDEIQKGESFASALSNYPKQFNETYVTLIEIGELSGSLSNVLGELSEYMSKNEKTKKKIKSASIYPIIIMSTLSIALVVGSVYLLPIFKEIFEEMTGDGMQLPLITRVIFGIADTIPIVAGVIAFMLLTINILRKYIINVDRFFVRLRDSLLIRIPIIREVSVTSYMHTIASTIGLMVNNGISINNSITSVMGAVRNVYIKNELGRISYLMESESFSFSESLREQEHMDQLLISMALTGEESGQMGEVLKDASMYYEEELDTMIDNAMEVLPQASMILMAIIVIPVIIAILLAILDLQTMSPV